jgi:pimeloyl-ACP methyl ester carboxylesterase
LTRAGIAVLRVDDRGTGESGPSHESDTTETFVTDVLAGVEFLKTRAEVDPKKIGLIGHSEGGLIAPMAAAKSGDVAFVVMLAAPGVTGREILVLQNELILRSMGVPEKKLTQLVEAQKAVVNALTTGKSEADLDSAITDLVRAQSSDMPGMPALTDEEMGNMVQSARRQLTSPWMRFFLQFDPAIALRDVRVPVLALNGSKDLQVDADQNLPVIERTLKAAGNADVTVKKLDGLNHLFQKAQTGSLQEYGVIEETFNEDAMKLIADWINQRFAVKP